MFRYARNFGPVTMMLGDEAHLWPHSESGMYRELVRGLGHVRVAGASGTVFRLQGGSLIEGEGAPFDQVVFRYTILDGIRDGYLCPAFSIGATEVVDASKLRTRQGEFTAESSDAQMLAAMDNHIAQMVHHGAERRAWLVFEAGTKAAHAMAQRMGEWGIPTGLVLGETAAGDRAATVQAFRSGRLRALVNVNALCIGFDVPGVDMLVMRRPTKSLGLYIQQVGRALRCVGGNIESSIAAGKADCAVIDFAGNIDRHGPLDFIRPKETAVRLVSCEACGTRNAGAAVRCWSCEEPMFKLCPACLGSVQKGVLDCPHCAFDMRTGGTEGAAPKLLDTPSGAALIASW
ncbi:MAG: helicase-related protein, partial [Halofilum sp. (in: g-proteobacteria)]